MATYLYVDSHLLPHFLGKVHLISPSEPVWMDATALEIASRKLDVADIAKLEAAKAKKQIVTEPHPYAMRLMQEGWEISALPEHSSLIRNAKGGKIKRRESKHYIVTDNQKLIMLASNKNLRTIGVTGLIDHFAKFSPEEPAPPNPKPEVTNDPISPKKAKPKEILFYLRKIEKLLQKHSNLEADVIPVPRTVTLQMMEEKIVEVGYNPADNVYTFTRILPRGDLLLESAPKSSWCNSITEGAGKETGATIVKIIVGIITVTLAALLYYVRTRDSPTHSPHSSPAPAPPSAESR